MAYKVNGPKKEVPKEGAEDYTTESGMAPGVKRALNDAAGDLPPELRAAMGLTSPGHQAPDDQMSKFREHTSISEKEMSALQRVKENSKEHPLAKNDVTPPPVPQVLLDVVYGKTKMHDPQAIYCDEVGDWYITHKGEGVWLIEAPDGANIHMNGVTWRDPTMQQLNTHPSSGTSLLPAFQQEVAKQLHTDAKYNVAKVQADALLEVAKQAGIDPGSISDGYHTFDELYLHRTHLIAVWFYTISFDALRQGNTVPVYRTRKHSDGTMFEGMFMVGLYSAEGAQITYHIEDAHWELFDFCRTLPQGPQWDGHTPNDVLKRLRSMVP
jgi:hypothetical protein